ncbi:MAG: helix-turn-helix transcriptional regulator [Proteobacteria bacterium]|nr:helix-turn-helix transcriptional regulator [Pseudomonadota bacterium]MBI3499347.1 helix-turn-helix transcriptional regulator [Pseudomonadota bacterium]
MKAKRKRVQGAEAGGTALQRRHTLGDRLRELRKAKGWTLSKVSEMTGLAPSTLSKVENKQISLTYDNLAKLADGLNIDLADLFTPETIQAATGRRTITLKGDGRVHETDTYEHTYHGAELSRKALVALESRVKATSLEAFGPLNRHPGEEWVYVLEGAIEFHSEFYEPVRLETGESVYFDATMGHALISVGPKPARVVSTISRPGTQPPLQLVKK